MVHALAVRKGKISLLCNGRPQFNTKGRASNWYNGDSSNLLRAMEVTKNSTKKILIPQSHLAETVSCGKCCSLVDPDKRKKYMKKIYKHSSLYQNRTKKNRGPVLETIGDEKQVLRNITGENLVKIPSENAVHLYIHLV